VARFTSLTTGQLPVVWFTRATVYTNDMWQTLTLTSDRVTRTSGRAMRSENVTCALSTILSSCVSVVTSLASLTLESFRVVLTLQTLSSGGITAAWKVNVNVVVARTTFACATWYCRISKVVVRTTVARRSCISPFAVADHLAGA
jgi:hypothetical protein